MVRRMSRVALAAAVVTVMAAAPASAADLRAVRTSRAAPTCTPRSAPAVLGVDGATTTTSVPTCTAPSGVTGYRVEALNRTGTAVVRTVDVSSSVSQLVVTGLTPGGTYRYRARARNADGAGPASALSPVTVQPFTSLAAFTDRQHRDFQGRPPTAAETTAWSTAIVGGTLTPVAAIDGADAGTYWSRLDPIVRLFQSYFLRLPDTAGLLYWVDLYRGGLSLNTISQRFAGTAEFTTRYGTLTDRQFVELIYLNILGRPGEPAGITYWTNEITSGRRTRGAVMIGLSESPENKTATRSVVDLVTLFTGLIRRVPTSAERTTWQARTRVEIITYLLASSTYAARTRVAPPAPPTAAQLANIALALDPRRPDDVDLFTSIYSGSTVQGLYPGGAAMAPATGPALTEAQARAALAASGSASPCSGSDVTEALALYDRTDVKTAIPDPRLRAAFASTAGTLFEPAMAYLLEAGLFSPAAYSGGLPHGAFAAVTGAKPFLMLFNRTYQFEDWRLARPSFFHELLHRDTNRGTAEEAILNSLSAVAYLQLLCDAPEVAYAGTELTRAFNDFAMMFLQSREAGSPNSEIRAPTGVGIAPGSTRDLPDLWSLFVTSPSPGETPSSPALVAILASLGLPSAAAYSQAAADSFEGLHDDWLSDVERARIAVLLQLVDVDEIAEAAGVSSSQVVTILGLQPVLDVIAAHS